MPQRSAKEVALRIEDDVHGSGVNQIDSCLFVEKMICSRKNLSEKIPVSNGELKNKGMLSEISVLLLFS